MFSALIRARDHAYLFAEDAGEVAGVGEASGQRDLGDVQRPAFEQIPRLLDAVAIEVGYRGTCRSPRGNTGSGSGRSDPPPGPTPRARKRLDNMVECRLGQNGRSWAISAVQGQDLHH